MNKNFEVKERSIDADRFSALAVGFCSLCCFFVSGIKKEGLLKELKHAYMTELELQSLRAQLIRISCSIPSMPSRLILKEDNERSHLYCRDFQSCCVYYSITRASLSFQ
jgi:hypothetical protein